MRRRALTLAACASPPFLSLAVRGITESLTERCAAIAHGGRPTTRVPITSPSPRFRPTSPPTTARGPCIAIHTHAAELVDEGVAQGVVHQAPRSPLARERDLGRAAVVDRRALRLRLLEQLVGKSADWRCSRLCAADLFLQLLDAAEAPAQMVDAGGLVEEVGAAMLEYPVLLARGE